MDYRRRNANRGKKVCSFICSKLQCEWFWTTTTKKRSSSCQKKEEKNIRWERDAATNVAISLPSVRERSTNRTDSRNEQCTFNRVDIDSVYMYRLQYFENLWTSEGDAQRSHELKNLFYEMNDRFGICVHIISVVVVVVTVHCIWSRKIGFYFSFSKAAKIPQCTKGVVICEKYVYSYVFWASSNSVWYSYYFCMAWYQQPPTTVHTHTHEKKNRRIK